MIAFASGNYKRLAEVIVEMGVKDVWDPRENILGGTRLLRVLANKYDGDIVLTIAHLDHVPENCADENLRAWCQRCHLRYDAEHHKQTAYRTRKNAALTIDMWADHAA